MSQAATKAGTHLEGISDIILASPMPWMISNGGDVAAIACHLKAAEEDISRESQNRRGGKYWMPDYNQGLMRDTLRNLPEVVCVAREGVDKEYDFLSLVERAHKKHFFMVFNLTLTG